MPRRTSRPNEVVCVDLDTGSMPEGVHAAVGSDLACRAAASNCTLLLTGETGVGKGRLARWIHRHSPRRKGPFVPVNCGAIPETLMDSQLFGHARGAFSGASRDHLGFVRAAESGTLLLDEVSELTPSAQNRLLRLLQDREVQPIGESYPRLVDVRVIAATNTDLHTLVADGRFREDLYFRLNVIQLNVPPLRQRIGELASLIETFNREFAEIYQQPLLEFDAEAMRTLMRYEWPGNIRQLRSLIERLHVLCGGEQITPQRLNECGQLRGLGADGSENLDHVKAAHLRRVLDRSGGSVAEAARLFGVHRSTIYRWLKKHGD